MAIQTAATGPNLPTFPAFALPPGPIAFERFGEGLTAVAEAQMALFQALLRLQFGVFGALVGAPSHAGEPPLAEIRPSEAAHEPDVTVG